MTFPHLVKWETCECTPSPGLTHPKPWSCSVMAARTVGKPVTQTGRWQGCAPEGSTQSAICILPRLGWLSVVRHGGAQEKLEDREEG